MLALRHLLISIFAAAPMLCAQLKPLEPIPVFLEEQAKVKAGQNMVPPWRCDLEGRMYSRIRTMMGTAVVRFNDKQAIDQTFTTSSVNEIKDYVIVDYAPDPGGGLIAIAAKKSRTEYSPVIFRFNEHGDFSGPIVLNGIQPGKLAVFANRTLLIGGSDSRGKWTTGIFRPDGMLLKNVNVDVLARGESEKSEKNSTKSSTETIDSEALNSALEFFPSQNGNIYAALIASVAFPKPGIGPKVLEISPSGEVRSYDIPVPPNAELFRLLVSVNHIFVLLGDREGKIDDIREFLINDAESRLDLFSRYRTLGAPQCVLDRSLLVVRPDSKGGQYLVTYSH